MSEQQNNGNYDDLVQQIREAAATRGKSAHGGMDSVPEDVRERPLQDHETDVPLDEFAETQSTTGVPEDLSTLDLKPHEQARADQATAARRTAAQTDTETASPRHTRRNVIAGSVAATLALALLYVGLTHEGGDNKTLPNTEPAVGATPTPGSQETPSEGSTESPESVITAPLDSNIDPDIPKYSDNQLALQENESTPNEVESALSANINPNAMQALVNNGPGFQTILNQYPEWDSLYNLYQQYGTANDPYKWAQLMGTRQFLNTVYQHNYMGMAEAYGEPQNFMDPKTAELIGQAPIVSVDEFNAAAKSNDFTPIMEKMFPDMFAEDNYTHALLTELNAGNNDPALVDRLTNYYAMGNEIQGAADTTGTGETRQKDITAMHDKLQAMYDAYQTDPTQLNVDAPTISTTYDKVAVIDWLRQRSGSVDGIFPSEQVEDSITSAVVYSEVTLHQDDDASKSAKYALVSVVSFVAAPTTDGTHQYVMPVVVDRIAQPL